MGKAKDLLTDVGLPSSLVDREREDWDLGRSGGDLEIEQNLPVTLGWSKTILYKFFFFLLLFF